NKVNRQYQQSKAYQVIHLQWSMKGERGEDYKHHQCNNLLNNFQLYQREYTSVPLKTNPVGRNLKAIFKKGDQPAEENDTKQRKLTEPGVFGKFEMSIPGKRHKNVGADQ